MENYFELMKMERYWSWSVIVIGYMIVTLLIRQLFFRGVVRNTKKIDPQLYSGVKKIYLHSSLGGWLIYLLSILCVVTVWVGTKTGKLEGIPFLLYWTVTPSLFFLSIILHFNALTRAMLTTLQQKMGVEKEF